jgi:hypothetical protein
LHLRHLRSDLNGCDDVPRLNEQKLDESFRSRGSRAIFDLLVMLAEFLGENGQRIIESRSPGKMERLYLS